MSTIDYYNNNSSMFAATTQNVDLHTTQDEFLSKLPVGGTILDFGCGAGRDTKYFLEKGYSVDAMDGSEEMCRIASEFTGIQVQQKLFQELDVIQKYDGIWACASILHVPFVELPDVFARMNRALKPEGVIYTSFKYGVGDSERGGRYFHNFTEDTWKMFLDATPGFTELRQWISSDARPGRADEKWLNLLLQKNL